MVWRTGRRTRALKSLSRVKHDACYAPATHVIPLATLYECPAPLRSSPLAPTTYSARRSKGASARMLLKRRMPSSMIMWTGAGA